MTDLAEQGKLAVAAEYAAASRANDGAALVVLSADGAVTWHNFDEKEVPTEYTVRTLAWLHSAVADLKWTDVAVRATADGFVWQSVLTGTCAGGALRVHSCVVVTLDGHGKITRTEEYLDSAQTSVLRG